MIVADHFDKCRDKGMNLSLGLAIPLTKLGFLLDEVFCQFGNRCLFMNCRSVLGRLHCRHDLLRTHCATIFAGSLIGRRNNTWDRLVVRKELFDQPIVVSVVSGPSPIYGEQSGSLSPVVDALSLLDIPLTLGRSTSVQQREKPLSRKSAPRRLSQKVERPTDLIDFFLREAVRRQDLAFGLPDCCHNALGSLKPPCPTHNAVTRTAVVRRDAVGRLQRRKPIKLGEVSPRNRLQH